MFWYFVHKGVILYFHFSFLDWVKISGWDQWGIIPILVDWKDGCGEASSKEDRNSLKDTDLVILFNDDNVIECWLCSLWSSTFVGRTKNSHCEISSGPTVFLSLLIIWYFNDIKLAFIKIMKNNCYLNYLCLC